jgi:hypothetical protein
VRLSPLGTAALLYQPQMIDEGDCGAIGGMKIGIGNRSTLRKPTPVPLCPPQIPHDQGSNPGRRGGKPATTCLSYGTATLRSNFPCSCVRWTECMLYRIHRIFLGFFHRPVFQKSPEKFCEFCTTYTIVRIFSSLTECINQAHKGNVASVLIVHNIIYIRDYTIKVVGRNVILVRIFST